MLLGPFFMRTIYYSTCKILFRYFCVIDLYKILEAFYCISSGNYNNYKIKLSYILGISFKKRKFLMNVPFGN